MVGYYICFCPSGVPLWAVCKNNSNIVTTLSHDGQYNTNNFRQTIHISMGMVHALYPMEKREKCKEKYYIRKIQC